jgi:hypothetical protein
MCEEWVLGPDPLEVKVGVWIGKPNGEWLWGHMAPTAVDLGPPLVRPLHPDGGHPSGQPCLSPDSPEHLSSRNEPDQHHIPR